MLGEGLGDRVGLLGVGHGLHGQQIRCGGGQHRQSFGVEVHQPLARDAVAAAVLAAVVADRAERADPGGHQHTRPGRLAGQIHTDPQRLVGLIGRAPGGDETLPRHLVARRHQHPRPGRRERAVHGQDLLRLVGQHPRRPQRVAQVLTPPFQLAGQAAVDDVRAAVQQGAEALDAAGLGHGLQYRGGHPPRPARPKLTRASPDQ